METASDEMKEREEEGTNRAEVPYEELQPSECEYEDDVAIAKRTAPVKKPRRNKKPKLDRLPKDWVSAFANPPGGFTEAPVAAATTVQPVTAKLMMQKNMLKHYNEPRGTSIPEGGYLIVDLFCSIGGVSSGATLEGHTVVLAVDFDARRLKVHALNFPTAKRMRMSLGPDTENRLVEVIRELVPQNEWHRLWIHASPPCQSQSTFTEMGKRQKRKQRNNRVNLAMERSESKESGIGTVGWTLNFIEKMDPPQFSIEEVSDKQGCVLKCMRMLRASKPSLIDCEVLDMANFGVPQTRERAIAARPATIHALRHVRSLRVDTLVSIQDVIELPEGVAYMRSRKSHKVNPEDVQPCPNIPGGFTDGFVKFYPINAPAPTQMGTAPHWDAADFKTKMGRLTAEQSRILATFPETFKWPVEATKKDAEEGYGNCVPPLFVQKLFRAASATAKI